MNMKKYKANTPEETIQKIRNILDHYEIPIKEMAKGDGDMFCSYRLSISTDDDIAIGTNGKGMTPIYAKASGYAEMMERFQNRVVIYPNPASYKSKCVFFPDEKKRTLSTEDIRKLVLEFIPRAFPEEGTDIEEMECRFLPFYHCNSQKVVEVPYSLIRWINGSNGMCAGNIKEEALIQGLNEIFERNSLQELYLQKLTPPVIPNKTFENTNILKNLERMKYEYGMDYEIRDCSLGKGFPVLGLLVYNPDKSKYIFQLGADLSATVALERCFTEIFQGHTAQSIKFDNKIKESESLDLFNEFKRSLVYGKGRMHKEFFNKVPSYAYSKHTEIPTGKDFKEDLQNIINWLISKGYNIYIRDNSFLGFPALHLCIPELADIDKSFCKLNEKIKSMQLSENNINPLFRLPLLGEKGCRDAISLLEMIDKDTIKLFPYNNHPQNNVNRHLLLMLIHYHIGNDKSALSNLDKYIKQKNDGKQNIRGYYPIIQVMLKGEQIPESPNKDWHIANTFIAHREYALKTCALPTCFECDTCEIKDGCRYTLLEDIEQKTQKAMQNYNFDQSKLSELFSSSLC